MSREGEGPCGFAEAIEAVRSMEAGGEKKVSGAWLVYRRCYCRAVLMLADAVLEAGTRTKEGERK